MTMISIYFFVYCLAGPVPLCTPLMGPHLDTPWGGVLGTRHWAWTGYDGTRYECKRHHVCLFFEDHDQDGDVDLRDFAVLQRRAGQ
jgi:hypothetical protein